MVHRHTKHDDGMYHIGGHKYSLLIGSRAQVWHRTAYKTSGGLTHADLTQNDEGRIVSKTKSRLGKSQKNLGAFLQPKGSGTFGPHTAKAKKGGKKSKTAKRSKKSRKH